MNRTRARALALVNWRGVFYERYLLDRHVTALEGANGAGKTTVMIAAYVVLLPDMSRLRFTNLGETGATGGDKGIWGRLGEPGRPSYAVFDFELPDRRRMLAGVHLERKGEPSVEPTPFVVSGLRDDVRLQDILLVTQGEQEVVPELPELRESAARLGGRLQTFPSAREYFAALFDQGVMPLRMGTDEERNKLNEMLRTSMTGGISRALTSELRAFLLKEEGGLADTLQRMRANLDACRRTRTEVQESRRLEQEIGGVFEAGQTMFAAAFLATRARADELERRVEAAEADRTIAAEARAAAHTDFEKTTATLEAIDRRRIELERVVGSARDWRDRLARALEAERELARYAAELERTKAIADNSAQKRRDAEALRDRARQARGRAQEGYKQAAAGLADLQRGIEELHRRADAHLRSVRRLRDAQEALRGAPLVAPDFDARVEAAHVELRAIDAERREVSTLLADAETHREDHAKAMRALAVLTGDAVPIAAAHEVALDALRRHRERLALAARLPEIEQTLIEERSLAARQSSARQKALALGVMPGERSGSDVVTAFLDEAEGSRSQCQEQARAAESYVDAKKREIQALDARRKILIEREPEWRKHAEQATRIAVHIGQLVEDRFGLDAAREELGRQLAGARRSEQDTREAQERLLQQARSLLAAGGPFPTDLLKLRDQLGAELVAGNFEDVGLEEAARIEARLGGLAQALVVDDPVIAARQIHTRPEALPEVLLVSRESDLEHLAGSTNAVSVGEADVAVNEGVALRVSRVPSHPRLGRRAREQRAAELRDEAEGSEQALDQFRSLRRQLERLTQDGDALLAGRDTWLAGDLGPERVTVERAILEARAEVESSGAEAARQHEAALALGLRIVQLRALLCGAFLLDPPDHAMRVAALEAERVAAQAALDTAASHGPHADLVDRKLATLRRAPLSDEELVDLRMLASSLKDRREVLDAGIEALTYVQANVEALGWHEAPRRLSENRALVPELQAQLDEAEDEQHKAEGNATAAEKRHDEATTRFQEADGDRITADKAHDSARRNFDELGVPEPTQEALNAAAGEFERHTLDLNALGLERDALIEEKGRVEIMVTNADDRLREAVDKVAGERREAEPAIKRWEDLRERATRRGLLAGMPPEGPRELAEVRGHVNFVQEANSWRKLLNERLSNAPGGGAVMAEPLVLRDPSDAAFANPFFDLWLKVRDWLRRRLPAHVAEVDDPREALLRLRDQLSGLEERLARQETDLRGASEDVARGIEVQIRKARGQVTRLNRHLDGVAFGSIQGIRVRLNSVERMEHVLRALRDGAAQGLLFQTDMPIEDALDEIFRRYGGGRSGGQRLLDYREYVHLQVEIRRKAGADWEVANPTRLSTGEAIGVGAALMMVVLTEWERDATLLRGRKSHGSLRFLFLDEANRLSHDNLGVLFDLCQTLDLQLLIAAPEVARAEGNTTYRLVR